MEANPATGGDSTGASEVCLPAEESRVDGQVAAQRSAEGNSGRSRFLSDLYQPVRFRVGERAQKHGVEPRLVIYIPYTELGPYLIKTDVDPLSLVAAVRDIIVSVDAQAAVTFSTLEQEVADSLARPRFYSVVAAIFGGVALVMALVGLYGVMAYAVGRRVHEIGVRMALGADRTQIRAMVVGEGMRPVLVGVAVGLVASVALMRVLEGLLYGMEALDPWIAVGVAVAMVGVAVAACYSPARHASQVDPLRALAHE